MKKRTTILLLLFFVLYMDFSSMAAAADRITWSTLHDGIIRAKAEKKAMIVDFFYNMDCPRCAKLQKEVYENPAIAKKIMDEFIPIRVDLTKKLTKDEEQLGEKYDYKKDCLLIFLDYDNNLIKDQTGKKLCFIDKVDPDEFIQYLDHIKKTYYKSQ
ncbi:MAG: thioredoxin family protein [Thermodesulfovibrionales bacterium]